MKRLQSKWIPKTIDIDYKNRIIIQEYYGKDLLHFKGQLKKVIPDLEEQVLEMYKFFKEKQVFKRNGSLSNMANNKGQLVAFDFKWATLRPEGLEKEIYSYENYLNKINPELTRKLKELL